MNGKTVNLIGGGIPYETPSVTVVDVYNEGLLCVSGDMDAKDWREGNTNWFEE